MKILIINTDCRTISAGLICYNLHNYFIKLGHESIICYGIGENGIGNNTVKVISKIGYLFHVLLARITGLQGYFSIISTMKICNIIKKFKPDRIYLGNLHGYYLSEFRLLNFIKSKNINTVYIMFDEYPYLGKCAYSGDCQKYKKECNNCPNVSKYPKSWFFDMSNKIFWDKYKAYQGFNSLVFVSVPYNILKASDSFLLKNKKLLSVKWGIDIKNTFKPKYASKLRTKLNISQNVKIVLNVAPFNDERKGVKKYFLEIAKKLKNEEIIFINVGFNGNIGLCPSNFIGISFIKDQDELSDYFSLADLLVITSRNDTYPTVALNSIACGTPVCGFNVSGIPFIAPEPICTCKEGIDDLTQFILDHPQKTDFIKSTCRNYAINNFDENIMNNMLFNLNDIF